MGYKRIRHEGKLTGLAAYGSPIFQNVFQKLIQFQNGQFRCKIPYSRSTIYYELKQLLQFYSRGTNYKLKMIDHIRSRLPSTRASDIAASLQRWMEEIMLEFINYYSDTFKLNDKHILLSGGIFANVLLNQKIIENTSFQQMSVVPNMGDGGLAQGACFLEASPEQKEKLFSQPQKHMYLGPRYSEKKIDSIVTKTECKHSILSDIPDFAQFLGYGLSMGYIIGMFNGRMEFGPRALGARSIIANPSDININAILNQRLHRTEFMPFAPYIRDVDAPRLLANFRPDDFTAQFMTRTYSVTDEMKEKAPAVVHLDGTARPQVISRESNPLYYDVLTLFQEITGIPVLINTSFNSHEEPIVMTPQDALRSFTKHNTVDLLVLEKTLITDPLIYQTVKNMTTVRESIQYNNHTVTNASTKFVTVADELHKPVVVTQHDHPKCSECPSRLRILWKRL
jgi:carbamoyltransferase